MFKKFKAFAFSFIVVAIILSCFSPLMAISCYSIEVDVYLQANGDAYIEEKWDMYIDKGTEVYKDESHLGDCEILNLQVKDSTGVLYTTMDSWNPSASFDQKKNKCGLNKISSGYEICWGVSQYGANRYTVSYTMTNFINSYDDYDGFYQRLINAEMSNPPQDIMVTIYAPEGIQFSDSNTKYQGLGFDGELSLYNNRIEIISNRALSSSNHVSALIRFDKGLFSPENRINKTYTEVEKEANEGRSQAGNAFIAMYPVLITAGICISGIILMLYIIRFYLSAKTVQKCYIPDREVGYFRDIPFNGDLIPAYFALERAGELKKDTDIIAAYLLKWMLNKNIRVEMSVKTSLFRTKEHPSIIFENTLGISNQSELKLYMMFESAAGNDRILQEDEFENWAKLNYERVEGLVGSLKMEGEGYFFNHEYISYYKKKGLFGLLRKNQRAINEAGIERVKEVLGLKDYLQEFTLINERTAVEVHLWKDYLIFASLFGIADEVGEQFKKIYPKYFEEYMPYYSNPYHTIIIMSHMTNSFNHGYTSGFESSHASTFSAGGGGGGFSGGGSGGGVR